MMEGLSGETPLGRLISIRAERDPEQIKKFTPEQRKIRNAYLVKQAQHKTQKQVDEALEGMKQAFIGLSK